MPKIVINSTSSGKFREETINGRPHIVTTMISIVGDSVMNRKFYPKNEVVNSHKQLNRIPAPASHPKVDGVFISANDVLAVNAHNIGGLVRSPQMIGNAVLNELALDVGVAEKDDRGKEALRRIKEGERIGVSTGLNATLTNAKGTHAGAEYDGVISNIKFDHVAILLDEPPAGDLTFTQNSDDKDVLICNLATTARELHDKVDKALEAKFPGDFRAHIIDIELLPTEAVIARVDGETFRILFGYDNDNNIVFTGEPVKVESVFKPVGGDSTLNNNLEVGKMDKEKFVLLIIANSLNSLTVADKDSLMSMTEEQISNALAQSATPKITVDKATKALEKEGLSVNAKDFDAKGYKAYVENKASFETFQAEKVTKRNAVIDSIVNNTSMTKADLENMSDEALGRTAQSLTPKQNYSAQGTVVSNAQNAGDVEVDYS